MLVQGQDVAVPLGRQRAMPARVSAAAAARVWPNLWPFRAERRLRGFSFAATDDDWTAGADPASRARSGRSCCCSPGGRRPCPGSPARRGGSGARLSPARTE
ncbi:hypothetical protein Aau02nite_32550 [Amorphoplanes auranticolor]|uniref:Uncharacterized protein n=1 Tax=Actinoplanes auranticolor TaxID=47988 RepID=A0A919SBJ1_9ACTN|nr:hypothetical protein Aau02nite_32550 [Actinoplanes auranticolor]